MNKIVTILLFLIVISCNSEKKQWRDLKRINSFSNIFKFAYNNRESIYLDSAIIMLDDTLSHTKDFWLWIHEAIWLIKNNKLKDRISSFYYTNFTELKAEIKTKNLGELEINQFKQLLCLFGLSIKN